MSGSMAGWLDAGNLLLAEYQYCFGDRMGEREIQQEKSIANFLAIRCHI